MKGREGEKEGVRTASSLEVTVRMRKIAKSSRFRGSVSTSPPLSHCLGTKSPTLSSLITQIELPGDERDKNGEEGLTVQWEGVLDIVLANTRGSGSSGETGIQHTPYFTI